MSSLCCGKDLVDSEDGSSDASSIAFSDAATSTGSFDPNGNDSRSIELDDEETRRTRLDAKMLQQEFPGLTYEECVRFRTIRTIKRARKKLKSYLQWRETYRMDDIPLQSLTFKNDEEVWDYAVSHSLSCYPEVKLDKKLPRIVRLIGKDPYKKMTDDPGDDDVTDSKSGKRILYILSGLVDSKIAPMDVYSLSLAVYFYLKLDRSGLEDIMAVTDARNGKGWANLSAASLLPFAKQVAKHLDFFPQRLDKFHAYPVPLAAKILWGVLKTFLKPVVVAKVNIHWGSSAIDADPPESMSAEHFDDTTMERLQRERISEFC